MIVPVLYSQNLLDVAIQHTGSVLNAFAISVANNICITDDLIPGSDIIIPEDVEIDSDVVNFYKLNGYQPATGITKKPNEEPALEGIGYWIIGKNFKVS